MTSTATEGSRWIHRFSGAAEGRTRLVCFPHVGGAASYFFPFAAALAPDIEVQAVQYPGRQERRLEKFIDSISEMADEIFCALRSQGGHSFAFFGHSMGAVVALEAARRFQRHPGEGPSWLFASGRRAPTRHRDEAVHLKDDAGVLAELRKAGGTNSSFLDDEELRQVILPVVRNDYKAIETYVYAPGAPLTCPITVLVGNADSHVTVEEAAAWAAHTTATFDLRVFSGGHFYLEGHQEEVAAIIKQADAARSRRRPAGTM